jgi:hypothetical protein
MLTLRIPSGRKRDPSIFMMLCFTCIRGVRIQAFGIAGFLRSDSLATGALNGIVIIIQFNN